MGLVVGSTQDASGYYLGGWGWNLHVTVMGIIVSDAILGREMALLLSVLILLLMLRGDFIPHILVE